MRILNRKQFLAEPYGTVFFDYTSLGGYSSLSVKVDEPDGMDCFFRIDTDHALNIGHRSAGASVFGTQEFIEATEAAERGEQASLYFDTCSRDDDTDKFAVLDDDDVERLIALLVNRKVKA